MSEVQRRPVVFLDRDGVLIEDVHVLTEPGELRLFPAPTQRDSHRAAPALRFSQTAAGPAAACGVRVEPGAKPFGLQGRGSEHRHPPAADGRILSLPVHAELVGQQLGWVADAATEVHG